MADEAEKELLDLLSEETYVAVRRRQIEADILLRKAGRAIAPMVNEKLAEIARKIATEGKE